MSEPNRLAARIRGFARFFMALLMTVIIVVGPKYLTIASTHQQADGALDLSQVMWRLKRGADDLAWAAAEYDDSDWTPFQPPRPLTRDPSDREAAFRLWFRARFDAPEVVDAEQALFLGRISQADETYLNGVRIGATGVFVDRLAQWRGQGQGRKARLYPIPSDLLRPTGNVLAVRVQGFSSGPGLQHGPFLIGDQQVLTRLARAQDLAIIFSESAYLAIVLFMFAFMMAGQLVEARDDRNFWLGPFMIAALVSSWSGTLSAYEIGWSPPYPGLIWISSPLLPFMALHLFRSLKVRPNWALVGSIAGFYGFIIAALLNDSPLNNRWIGGGVILTYLASIALLSAPAFAAWRSGHRVSIWSYIAVASMIIAVFAHFALEAYVFSVVNIMGAGFAGAVVHFTLANADHNAWNREAVGRMSANLLRSREEERERLAKSLHDGLSQQVAAARFRLEWLRRLPPEEQAPEINDIIRELREIGFELTATVERLRPVNLLEMTFADSLGTAVDRWNRSGRIQATLDITGGDNLTNAQRSHLYRILQEAIYNAVRHGRAKTVQVRLETKEAHGALTVIDDGAGFNVDKALHKGVGLAAMKEHAHILGGALQINSTLGKGSTIIVSF